MGRFAARYPVLLSDDEHRRLAALRTAGIPQYIRDEIAETPDAYWKRFILASRVSAIICAQEAFERRSEVTGILLKNYHLLFPRRFSRTRAGQNV